MVSRNAGEKGGITDPVRFIRENTRLAAPSLVPEIVLHLADEGSPLWRRGEEELAALGLPSPYWAFAWAGGQALARHVLDNPALLRGRRVLDFGAGSGVVAIAAGLAGAERVRAADIDAFARLAIAMNGRANGVAVEIIAEDPLTGAVEDAFDVILAGDVFYEWPAAGEILSWLSECRGRGIDVLIGDPDRHFLPRARLRRLAEYSVCSVRELEDLSVRRSAVWRLEDGRGGGDIRPAVRKSGGPGGRPDRERG